MSEETVRNENPTSIVNFNVIMLRSPIGRLALDVLQECYVELSTTVGLMHVRYMYLYCLCIQDIPVDSNSAVPGTTVQVLRTRQYSSLIPRSTPYDIHLPT